MQRQLRGWSQEDVATGLHRVAASLGERELGVDATMVSRWERGTRRPRPRYVRLLCRLFELPAEQLGMVEYDEPGPAPAARGPLGDAERPDFIRDIGGLLGVAALPLRRFEPAGQEAWERLARALHRLTGVDDETVNHLERTTIALQSLGPTQVGSRVLLGPVTGHLDAISLLLQGTLAPALRARLCSLAAETAGFVGWLRWNMDQPAAAAAYFRTGLDAAREAEDRALGAYLMGSAACQPPYRGNPRERLQQLTGRTFGFAQSDASPSTRAWLAAKEADVHALLGDADSCLRALDRAQSIVDRAAPEDERRRPRFSLVDDTWLQGEWGASLARLGRTAEARLKLESVLASLGPTSESDRLWLLAALASTHVRDREPEEACRVIRQALARAARMQFETILKVLRGLLQELSRYRDVPAVLELAEEFRSTAGVLVPS